MKKYIFVCFLLFAFANAQDVEIKNIDEKIFKIDSPRVGITIDILSGTKNSFFKEDVDIDGVVVQQQVEKIALKGIMNNRAFINNKWFGLNDEVEGYTLVSITSNSVLLKREDRTKELFLKNKKDSFIKIEAR
ncbi:MAG: hypothetical protein JXQ68_02280 [Campylobacterales bacterium]|nr:hypothetical protein [Campylobacterales bacterium]